jgi:hypothetical protein
MAMTECEAGELVERILLPDDWADAEVQRVDTSWCRKTDTYVASWPVRGHCTRSGAQMRSTHSRIGRGPYCCSYSGTKCARIDQTC